MGRRKLISVGYKNVVAERRVLAVISPDSRPVRQMISNARDQHRLIDATMGKKTKSVLVLDTNHVLLSANTPETIIHRIRMLKGRLDKVQLSDD